MRGSPRMARGVRFDADGTLVDYESPFSNPEVKDR